ncbi:hypothetical protein ASPSYDRAFT_49807 [Aspergillus sydowii CBS 593.65]|uniref:Uncharacterized protein n=1 Tax=Aspergillus sydowii CBS 593.65 TaxID=1036612 RepID=A0A1L9T5W8_9EURO|nr:uncharacterized protein ASPSYDRAFT_49807 [Aspergillus sydowii CBS 593.65]OJJ54693.1 hypothetical protein ASPSYDRAFT_49807 [Aspergillus sydowii CBS 593.65]
MLSPGGHWLCGIAALGCPGRVHSSLTPKSPNSILVTAPMMRDFAEGRVEIFTEIVR